MMQISDTEFQLLQKFLLRETGIDVPDSKRYLFTTRLTELLEKEKCKSFSEFLLQLSQGNDVLVRAMVESMTTHESSFFRDPQQFQALADNILPMLVAKKDEQIFRMPPRIRILSVGCSFGQEPYTIAMSVDRWLSSQAGSWSLQDFSITGIDLSTRAIERARQGLYSRLELGTHISDENLHRYFTQQGDRWLLSDAIRPCVSFQQVNLAQAWPNLGRFDLIFCRNVLIYFSVELKQIVLDQLRSALEPEGILFLGATESMYGLDVDFTLRTIGQVPCYEALPSPIQSEELPWKF